MELSKSIRVVSTRALRAETILFAKERGWIIEVYPMIETVFSIDREQVYQIIGVLNNSGSEVLLIFSSSNAVRALDAGFKNCNIVFPAGIKACFVGENTAEIASALLQTKNIFIAGNANELLDFLIYPEGETILFMSGHKRLNTLPDGLINKGFKLVEYKLYDTLETPVKIEKDFDAVLFFSPTAVDSFLKLNTWKQDCTAISIGNTTAGALRNCGVERIIIAVKPGEIKMMQALASHIDENK